ncbi:MAG: hypothetical protein ACQEUT_10150 [Bacillota bacterium]
MTVNHGGTLGKEYFISYLSLVMNSRGCSPQQAKEITLSQFFKGSPEIYGHDTYNAFIEAYSLLIMK